MAPTIDATSAIGSSAAPRDEVTRHQHGQLGDADVARAVRALRRGDVVAAATESFFALMVDAESSQALDRLFALKGRAPTKGVGLMVPSVVVWTSLVGDVPELGARLAGRYWPGPLTLVLPAARALDPRVLTAQTVAVRIPGPSPAATIVAAFGGPVTATSANLAGEPPCAIGAELRQALEVDDADVLVVGPDAPGGPVSTLVSIDNGQVRVLRQGAISDVELSRIVSLRT